MIRRLLLIAAWVFLFLPGLLQASEDRPPKDPSLRERGAAEGAAEKGRPFFFLPADKTRADKHHLRTVLELTSVLGLTAALYYSPEGRKRNENDWEYPFTWETFRKKVFFDNTVRFDNNAADINLGHVGAGTAYYLIARSNGLNAAEAFAYTFGASSLWEILGEIREVYSINDQIVTTWGGWVFGETLHQLGRYLRYGPVRSPLRNFLAAVIDPPTAFHLWWERRLQGRTRPLGLQPVGGGPGRLELYGATAFLRRDERLTGAGALGCLAEIGRPSRWGEAEGFRTFYDNTVLTKARIEYLGNRRKVPNDFLLRSKVIFGGYRLQDRIGEGEKEKSSYDLLLGPSSAVTMEVVNRGEGGGWIADFQLFGPALEAAFFYDGWRLRLSADLYGDFAMIQSRALKEYKKIHGGSGLVGVQQKEGDKAYYYGIGWSKSLNLSLARGAVELGASVRRGDYWEIRGRDLLEEQITKRLNLRDRRVEMELRATYTPAEDWGLEAYVLRTRWASRAETLSFSEGEVRYGLRLRFFFS